MPKNVVLLMADQLTTRALGFMGNSAMQTPNLDRLATSGVVFDQAFVQCPVCMASRAAIHTGRYPDTLRVRSMGLLPPGETTIAETLKRAGYSTGMFGKLHFTPQQYTLETRGRVHPVTDAGFFLADAGIDTAANRAVLEDPCKREYGFDVSVGVEDFLWGNYLDWLQTVSPEHLPWAIGENMGAKVTAAMYGVEPKRQPLFPEYGHQLYDSQIPAELHPSTFIVKKTIEFIRDNRERPFFAHCSFVDPHHPFNAPPPFNAMYPAADIPAPQDLDLASCYPNGLPPGVWSSIKSQHGHPNELWQVLAANYYGMVSHLDSCVGQLLQELTALDLLNETIIVFVADHGEYIGNHRLLKKGSLLFDSLMQVPLVVSGAGVRGGVRRPELVQEIDIYPTVMSLLGLPIHAGVQGKSLVPLLAGRGDANSTAVWRPYDYVYCGLDELTNPIFANPVYMPSVAVRSKEWKFNYFPQARTGMMFNLAIDPGETRNLIAEPAAQGVRHELTMHLLDHHHQAKDPLPLRLSQA